MKAATMPHLIQPGWAEILETATVLKTNELESFIESPEPNTMLIIPWHKEFANIIYENADPKQPFSVFSNRSNGAPFSKVRCAEHLQELIPHCAEGRCLRVQGDPIALHNFASGLRYPGETRFPMPAIIAEAVREKLIVRAVSTPLDFD